MDARGKVLLQLGRKGVPGMSPTNFNLPTDVAFASNGDVYVSDGYGNPRVVKYSRDGKYLLQWGKRGSGPGEFQLPHNIVVDARDRVYVTDRDNRRVEIFDANGKFLNEWRDTGGVSALAMTGDQHIWTGEVLRSLDGKPVARLSKAPTAHGMAVGASGEVYVGQLSGVVQKFVRR
jgi:DNA-binding beta-propeller fold protein YncE